MHPGAAAKMFASGKGHMIVATRFTRTIHSRTFYRFAYDMGKKLYAVFCEFIVEVFASSDPKEQLGGAIEVV